MQNVVDKFTYLSRAVHIDAEVTVRIAKASVAPCKWLGAIKNQA